MDDKNTWLVTRCLIVLGIVLSKTIIIVIGQLYNAKTNVTIYKKSTNMFKLHGIPDNEYRDAML